MHRIFLAFILVFSQLASAKFCEEIFNPLAFRQNVRVPTEAIRNQCLGTCALNATLTWLELRAMRETGHYVRFSFEALLADVLLRKVEEAGAMLREKIEIGTHIGTVLDSLRSTGLYPEEAMPTRILHEQGGEACLTKLIAALENLVEESRKIHPDFDGEALKQLRTKAQAIIYGALGWPPREFVFEGKIVSAEEFTKRFPIPTRFHHYWDHLMEYEYYPVNYSSNDNSMRAGHYVVERDLFRKVRGLLDAGQPILGTIEINHAHIDRASGIVSTLHVPSEREEAYPHAVVVTGYEIDPSGNLIGLIFQNSWGAKSGLAGRYIVMLDYLEKYELQLYLGD